MFNTAWTDLVLKVGGQILLAVLIILAVTFGADPLFPKKNMASMIASRAEQPTTKPPNVAKPPNAVKSPNAAKPTNKVMNTVVQTNASVKLAVK